MFRQNSEKLRPIIRRNAAGRAPIVPVAAETVMEVIITANIITTVSIPITVSKPEGTPLRQKTADRIRRNLRRMLIPASLNATTTEAVGRVVQAGNRQKHRNDVKCHSCLAGALSVRNEKILWLINRKP